MKRRQEKEGKQKEGKKRGQEGKKRRWKEGKNIRQEKEGKKKAIRLPKNRNPGGNRSIDSKNQLDFLDVHIARYDDDTSWSDRLKKLGARVEVWPAEGLDEEISYLKDLVASYNTTRAAKVFLHGTAPTDWHSTQDILGVISKIDLSKLKKMGGYASLNSGIAMGHGPNMHMLYKCTNHTQFESQWQLLRYRMDCHWKDDLWVKMLKSRWNLPSEGGFTKFGGYCCSQFVVTRDAIHQYPISFYKSLLNRLSSKQPWLHTSTKTLGRTMDYIWHIIYTGSMIEPKYSPTAFTLSWPVVT